MSRWVEPLKSAPQRLLMALVRGYRFFLSPWLGSACRFEPTCSVYSLQALERHGALGGSYLTLHRLARCHPWCNGGHDPVPDTLGGLFTRLEARRSDPISDAASRIPSPPIPREETLP
jgi:putative membrane protein insertion efficiency factor